MPLDSPAAREANDLAEALQRLMFLESELSGRGVATRGDASTTKVAIEVFGLNSLSAGEVIRYDTGTSGWVKALSDSEANIDGALGVVEEAETYRFRLVLFGEISLSGLTVGQNYLDNVTAGALTSTSKGVGLEVLFAISATEGYVHLRRVMKNPWANLAKDEDDASTPGGTSNVISRSGFTGLKESGRKVEVRMAADIAATTSSGNIEHQLGASCEAIMVMTSGVNGLEIYWKVWSLYSRYNVSLAKVIGADPKSQVSDFAQNYDTWVGLAATDDILFEVNVSDTQIQLRAKAQIGSGKTWTKNEVGAIFLGADFS